MADDRLTDAAEVGDDRPRRGEREGTSWRCRTTSEKPAARTAAPVSVVKLRARLARTGRRAGPRPRHRGGRPPWPACRRCVEARAIPFALTMRRSSRTAAGMSDMVQHVHGQGHIHAAVTQRQLLRVGLDQGQPSPCCEDLPASAASPRTGPGRRRDGTCVRAPAGAGRTRCRSRRRLPPGCRPTALVGAPPRRVRPELRRRQRSPGAREFAVPGPRRTPSGSRSAVRLTGSSSSTALTQPQAARGLLRRPTRRGSACRARDGAGQSVRRPRCRIQAAVDRDVQVAALDGEHVAVLASGFPPADGRWSCARRSRGP